MNNERILIVEDEVIVALDVKSALKSFGYKRVTYVTNYTDAINFVKEENPTLIFMDINLKNSKDGIETATQIQKIKNIPIIYLTAYSDEKTIGKAVKTNPIGYLLKPFKREELKTTIFLALHKINSSKELFNSEDFIHLGLNYYYNLKDEILFYENIPIKLSIKERALLSILVEAKGNIVSFNTLEALLWPDFPVSNGALRTLLYRVRSKLEYKLIETIPSLGCKLSNKI
ncbi:response regulator [Halarcobacter bivalviorum]|uniref:response regulator n=1 Tax=Halarcobacter bivalviorum TaxID=663364 RepID=UPI00100A4E52|nr:response regulator [Halarcobacter bivalviorum]RXK05698.1 DNA-binding response regulator [Halarcobacter bivalviorum]